MLPDGIAIRDDDQKNSDGGEEAQSVEIRDLRSRILQRFGELDGFGRHPGSGLL